MVNFSFYLPTFNSVNNDKHGELHYRLRNVFNFDVVFQNFLHRI